MAILFCFKEVLMDGKACPAKAEYCMDASCVEHPKTEAHCETTRTAFDNRAD